MNYKMLDQQKAERRKILIEGKKQHYKQIIARIYKKYRITAIGIEVLGITETGEGEVDILYKTVNRNKSIDIKEISIKKKENKTMFKIIKPEENSICASRDFWLFKEDIQEG